MTSNAAPAATAAVNADRADFASLTVVGLIRQLASISSRMRRFVVLSSTARTRNPSSARRAASGAGLTVVAGLSSVAVKKNVLPRPSVLSAQTRPPMSSTRRTTIARPSPVPP